MKLAAVVLFALALAGCEHMYGAVDGGRLAPLGSPTSVR